MFRHLIACVATAAALATAPAFAANPQVELDTTAGNIVVELYPDAAPKTVTFGYTVSSRRGFTDLPSGRRGAACRDACVPSACGDYLTPL